MKLFFEFKNRYIAFKAVPHVIIVANNTFYIILVFVQMELRKKITGYITKFFVF